MSIHIDEIKKVASLAKIYIPEERLGKYQEDINSILHFFDKLDEIDISSVSSDDGDGYSVECMPERQDIPCVCDPRVLDNAPELISGMFAVPKVVE